MFRAKVTWRLLGALVLASILAGCFPPPESKTDEQRDPHYLAGRSKAEAQDSQGAIDEFEKALEVNPRNASAHFFLGTLRETYSKDYAAAIYHYEKFLQRPVTAETKDTAEQANNRIKACKQALASEQYLPTTALAMQHQLEQLIATNKDLTAKVAALQYQLDHRPAPEPRVEPRPMVVHPAAVEANRAVAPAVHSTAPARDNAPAEPARTQATTYAVVSGDTMALIARKHRVKLAKLQAANPGVDSRRLKVGQKLVIPPS